MNVYQQSMTFLSIINVLSVLVNTIPALLCQLIMPVDFFLYGGGAPETTMLTEARLTAFNLELYILLHDKIQQQFTHTYIYL